MLAPLRPGVASRQCAGTAPCIATIRTAGHASCISLPGVPDMARNRMGVGLGTCAGTVSLLTQGQPTSPSSSPASTTTCHALPWKAALDSASQAASPWLGIAFSHITVTMVFMYALMVFAPRASLTSKVMRSSWVLAALAISYAATLTLALHSGLWQSLVTIYHQVAAHPQYMPDPAAIGKLFHSPLTTLAAWIHLMMLDFYQAREVWFDGLVHRIPTTHSVILCFFVGPLGILSHSITRTLTAAKSG